MAQTSLATTAKSKDSQSYWSRTKSYIASTWQDIKSTAYSWWNTLSRHPRSAWDLGCADFTQAWRSFPPFPKAVLEAVMHTKVAETAVKCLQSYHPNAGFWERHAAGLTGYAISECIYHCGLSDGFKALPRRVDRYAGEEVGTAIGATLGLLMVPQRLFELSDDSSPIPSYLRVPYTIGAKIAEETLNGRCAGSQSGLSGVPRQILEDWALIRKNVTPIGNLAAFIESQMKTIPII